MKITAFAASNSTQSINLALVKAVLNHLEDHEIEILDLNDFEMPIYSQDRNNSTGIPKEALRFNEIIKNSDALLVGLAEHNGTFSTAFKNIFDWGSRAEMSFFQQKPMMLLSTSPGARGGLSVMNNAKDIFPVFGGNIVNTFCLPSFKINFADGKITNDELNQQLTEKITAFKARLV